MRAAGPTPTLRTAGWLAGLLLLAAGAAHPAGLADLAWLTGTWTSAGERGASLEQWSDAEGGVMLGVHRDVFASGRVDFEFLRLAETDDGVVYYASPGGRYPATAFPLVESGERRAVFANPEHDFPKRLVYWIDEEGLLHARAEGEDGRGPEWRWQRAD